MSKEVGDQGWWQFVLTFGWVGSGGRWAANDLNQQFDLSIKTRPNEKGWGTSIKTRTKKHWEETLNVGREYKSVFWILKTHLLSEKRFNHVSRRWILTQLMETFSPNMNVHKTEQGGVSHEQAKHRWWTQTSYYKRSTNVEIEEHIGCELWFVPTRWYCFYWPAL